MPDATALALPAKGPLGILGGTFDPVHYGHLRLAEEACQALGLSGVRWIPAGLPPHRAAPAASAEDRLAMVRRGIAANPLFSLDDSEVLSKQPSYSVPTLQRLRGELGLQRPLVLLLGVDAFLGLTGWHRWRELFDLAHLAVATRPGYELAADQLEEVLAEEFRQRECHTAAALAAAPAGRILAFRITALDISATVLRALCKAGDSGCSGASGRYLLPDSVLEYISIHHIYA